MLRKITESDTLFINEKPDGEYGLIFECRHKMIIEGHNYFRGKVWNQCISIFPCHAIYIDQINNKAIHLYCNKGMIEIPWIDYLILNRKKIKRAKYLLYDQCKEKHGKT